jgi:cell division protein YceG involved in septum cleavage
MKITLSKRLLAVVIFILLFLSVLNTYLILEQNRALQDAAHDSTYDYVIFQDGTTYKAVNQASGSTEIVSDMASQVINQSLAKGNAVYLKPGNYTLTSDVQVHNKINAKIVSDGASIMGNGHSIIVRGDNYTFSQNNLVSGLTIVNGTLRIENSFGTTVQDMAFVNCSTALELANTATWTEGTTIEGQLRDKPLLLQPHR